MDKLLLEKVESIQESLKGISERFPKNVPRTLSGNDTVEERDTIDLRELMGTLINDKWLIILITTITITLGIAKTQIDTPIYLLDALLQVEEAPKSLGDFNPIDRLIDNKTSVQAEVAIIKSRMVLGEAVANLKLDIVAEPKYFPVFGRPIARKFSLRNKNKVSLPLFNFTEYAWGGERINVKSLTVPESWLGKKMTLVSGKEGHFKVIDSTKQLIIEGNVGKLSATTIKGENTPFSLFISLLKARPGTHFIISKQAQFNVINRLQERLSVTEQEIQQGFLNFTMESTIPNIAMQTINEIANIYVRLNVEQKSEEAQKTLEFLENQLPKVKNQVETATAALNEYRLKKGSIDLDIETEDILSGVVELKTKITLLQQKKDELHRNFTSLHPSVIANDKQISRLKTQLNSHNKRIEDLPKTQQVILRLSRDVEVDTQLYTLLLNQLQTIKVTKAGTVGDVRIIDYAVLPIVPIKPKKIQIVALAIMLGVVLGIIIALTRKLFRQGIEDPLVIEQSLNIPVYSTIPHSNFQQILNRSLKKNRRNKHDSLNILALQKNEDQTIESLRSLQATLHFAFLGAKNKTILITGPSPEIGKSFISLNLAVVLANSGKKVLLVDADMRKGSLNKVLGVSRENGLSDLILNLCEPAEVIKTIYDAGIDFISTGKIPPNPSDLLLNERFEKLLTDYNKYYDLIVIDSPPILAVADASIIGRTTGVSLMVVKSGEHTLGDLQLSIKRFSQNNVNIKGIIFNDLPVSSVNYGYEKYSYY